MTKPLVVESLETLVDAPGGIPRIRELVLELAVRGKLVEQAPSDKPASTLLSSFAEQHDDLVRRKAIRSRRISPVDQDESPFELPAAWEWSRIGRVAHDLGQEVPAKRFTYIDVSAIDRERGRIGEEVSVVAVEDAPSRARKIVKSGCVIYSTVRPYLRNIAILDYEFTPAPIASTAFSVLMPYEGLSNQYLYYYLRSPVLVRYVEEHQKGVAYPAINDGDFQRAYIPIPPRDEQHRIVARVDELMALLDRLDAAKEARDATREQLRDAALAALQDANDAEEVKTARSRIGDHMHDIFTDPADIPPLRHSILQMAVRGRLVAQVGSEESAASLLARIKTANSTGRRTSRLASATPAVSDNEGQEPWPVPASWQWTRFAVIAESRLGKMLDKAKNTGPHRPYLRNANLQWFRFDLTELKELRLEDADLDEHTVQSGDLLICEGGEPGRAAVADASVEGMVFQKALHRARPRLGISSWFLAYLLRSDAQSGRLAEYFTGATIKHFTGKALGKYSVPLPPLQEQRRIVTKVQELMAMVDQLEEALRDARETQEAFSASAVRDLPRVGPVAPKGSAVAVG